MEQLTQDAGAVAADRQRAWADVERVRGNLARSPPMLQVGAGRHVQLGASMGYK